MSVLCMPQSKSEPVVDAISSPALYWQVVIPCIVIPVLTLWQAIEQHACTVMSEAHSWACIDHTCGGLLWLFSTRRELAGRYVCRFIV